jgi:hypothetical protein
MDLYTDYDVKDLLRDQKFQKKVQFGTGKTLKSGDLVIIYKYYPEHADSGVRHEAEYPKRNLMVVEALKLGLDHNYLTIFGHEEGCRVRFKVVTKEDFVRKDVLQTVRYKLEHKTP